MAERTMEELLRAPTEGYGEAIVLPEIILALEIHLQKYNINYEATCEEKAKRRNSGTKTKTFEDMAYLQQYAVSNKEDMAYLRQLITRTRSYQFPIRRIHCYSIRRIDSFYLSQRYALNVINGN
ncbi:hypothetical protein Tco_1410432 [Tanacetum coccineum]